MNLTFITDEYSQNFTSAIAFAKEQRLRGVELRSLDGRGNVVEFAPAALSEIKSRLDDAGLEAVAIDSFVFKCQFDSPLVEQLDLANRAADAAATLRAPAVRIFAFWREGAPELDAIAERVTRVADIAQQRQVAIWVENGTFSSVGCGLELAKLLALIDRTNVFALWDAGNVLNGGWPSGVKVGLSALANRLAHVHVKNPHHGAPGSMQFGPLSGGLIDWSWQIATLRRLGFSGYASLETHWRTDRTLKGRGVFDLPGGPEFSHGGELATASMLDELRSEMSKS